MFGPPNIKKLFSQGNTQGLIKALSYSGGFGHLLKSEYQIHLEAVNSLGLLRDKAATIPLLNFLSKSKTQAMRKLIIESFGKIGDPASVETLLELYNNETDFIKREILLTLGKTKDERGKDIIINAVRGSNVILQRAGIIAAGNFKDSDFAKELNEIYRVANDNLRPVIASSLTEMGWRPLKHYSDSWQVPEIDVLDLQLPSSIQKQLEKKGDLPPLPEILIKFNKMINDPNTTLIHFADLLRTDQAITAKIIQVSNSSYYSPGTVTISNLLNAVTRLGLREIKNVVVALAMIKQFINPPHINKKEFWVHSMLVAVCSQYLSRIMQAPDKFQDIAYISGLMHDVGLMVFNYIFPEKYHELIVRLQKQEGDDFDLNLCEEEYGIFEVDHAHLGAAYIEYWWPIDKNIVQTVRDHHLNLDTKDLSILSKVIILVNNYCEHLGVENGLKVKHQRIIFHNDNFKLIGMTDTQIEQFVETVERNIDLVKQIISN